MTIRDYMAQLGKRKKRMSPAAIAQRRLAGVASGAARRRPPRPESGTPLAQSEDMLRKGTPLAQSND